jgi:hypothetical protein
MPRAAKPVPERRLRSGLPTPRRLRRFQGAIGAGIDPTALVDVINEAHAQRAAARAGLDGAPASDDLTSAEVHAMIDSLGDVGTALNGADPESLERLYGNLRLELLYNPLSRTVDVRLAPVWLARVSGGLSPPHPPHKDVAPRVRIVVQTALRQRVSGRPENSLTAPPRPERSSSRRTRSSEVFFEHGLAVVVEQCPGETPTGTCPVKTGLTHDLTCDFSPPGVFRRFPRFWWCGRLSRPQYGPRLSILDRLRYVVSSVRIRIRPP